MTPTLAHSENSLEEGRATLFAALRNEPASRGALLPLWLLVVLVPLAVVPGAADAFALPKLVLAQTLGLLSLAVLAPAIVAGLLDRPVLLRRLAWVLLPPLAVATAGWAFTDHPLQVGRALGAFWVGAACLAGWALALPAARLRGLLDALIVPAMVLGGLGILQYHGLFQPFRFSPLAAGVGAQAERLHVSSLAGNPGDLAAFLVLPGLLAQAGMARDGGRRRWGWALGLGVCLYAIAVTQTLTALAALAAGSAVFWGLQLPRHRSLKVLALALALAAVAGSLIAPLRARTVAAARDAASGELEELLTGRLDGWRTAAWMASRNPATGVGHGAYRAAFAEAKLELSTAGVGFYPHHMFPTFVNAHNELFEVAAEWGVPGLLALGLSLGILLAALARRSRGAPGPQASGRALAWAGIAAWLVLSLAYFPFRLALTSYPALLFLAWALRWSGEGEE
jgi:O-antigen ligase